MNYVYQKQRDKTGGGGKKIATREKTDGGGKKIATKRGGRSTRGWTKGGT